jgi:hypothetical protein
MAVRHTVGHRAGFTRFVTVRRCREFRFCTHLLQSVVYSGSMEAVRQSWTDDRLDDFRDEVNRRFDDVDGRFEEFGKQVDKRFDKVDGELGRLDAKIDGLQRTLMLTGGGIIAALLGILGTIVSVALTQL